MNQWMIDNSGKTLKGKRNLIKFNIENMLCS
jgi:hypothetical protein